MKFLFLNEINFKLYNRIVRYGYSCVVIVKLIICIGSLFFWGFLYDVF